MTEDDKFNLLMLYAAFLALHIPEIEDFGTIGIERVSRDFLGHVEKLGGLTAIVENCKPICPC
jgi:hypothetical protein